VIRNAKSALVRVLERTCTLCAEVAKLRVQRRTPGDVAALRAAVAATGGLGAGSPQLEPEPDRPAVAQLGPRKSLVIPRALATRAADSKGA
jgi:hypothetical protein